MTISEYYFSADNKTKTAQLFYQNLMWGNVRIEYDKFPTKKGGLKFAQEMYRKLTAWDNEALCGSDDPQEVDRIVDWVYEGITKGRSYGAIIGEMHDKTYEAKITELEQELERWKQAHERVKQDNIILANELVDRQNIINAYESTFGVRKDGIDKE